MKTFLRITIKIVSNKYFLTTLVFVIWTLFFDQNDWLTLQQKAKELKAVKADIAYLNREIENMYKEKEDLNANPKVLEQYARENYRMKKEDEDVYVIEKK